MYVNAFDIQTGLIGELQERGWSVMQFPILYQATEYHPIHAMLRFLHVRHVNILIFSR